MTLNISQEAELLRKVPMFSKMESSKLKLLAFTSESLAFDDGESLCRAGDLADCAYVIMSGEVEILGETPDGAEVIFGVRGANELIGEMAVVTNSPRSASVRALGEVMAMRIMDEALLKLLSENPEIALDVMRQLSERLADATEKFRQVQIKLQRYESQ